MSCLSALHNSIGSSACASSLQQIADYAWLHYLPTGADGAHCLLTLPMATRHCRQLILARLQHIAEVPHHCYSTCCHMGWMAYMLAELVNDIYCFCMELSLRYCFCFGMQIICVCACRSASVRCTVPLLLVIHVTRFRADKPGCCTPLYICSTDHCHQLKSTKTASHLRV